MEILYVREILSVTHAAGSCSVILDSSKNVALHAAARRRAVTIGRHYMTHGNHSCYSRSLPFFRSYLNLAFTVIY